MPNPTVSPLERACQLARSGRCRSTAEILQALKDEGDDRRLVIGPYLMRRLQILLHDAARLKRSS